jgi:cytochrome c-type biogenesis protein CcmH
MVLFIILAAVLTLIAAALLVRPFLRRMEAPAPPSMHGQAVYRDQLDELDRDAARGVISAEEAAAARAEIGRRILAAGRDAAQGIGRPAAPPARIVAALVVIAPLLAIGLYAWLGRPGAPDQPLAVRLAAGEATNPACTTELEGAIARFSEQIRRNPQDFEARVTLARVLSQCRRHAEALDHYRQAIALPEGEADADLKVEYGQARIVAADGSVDAEAFDLFRDVFQADPQHQEARLYLGLAMAEYGEFDAARTLWESLLADAPDAPWAGTLRQQLAVMPRGSSSAGAAPDPDAPDPAPAPQ